MFQVFFGFELRFWIKSFMVWIFLAVLTFIIVVLLLAEESVLDDLFFSNSLRNSPFVIQRLYGITAVFGCLMVTAFVNSAAVRDFACDTQQLIFTKPISKYGYLLGRFFAATLISLIPMLGASLAVFIAQTVSPGPQWGPTYWSAHGWSILGLAIPNTFFVSAVVFSIAIWTRSTLASFLGILGLMVVLSISGALLGSLASETIAAMADPFGDTALANVTKYWTVAEKNSSPVPLTGVLLWNRLLWVGAGTLFLIAGCLKFSFTSRPGWIAQLMNLIKSSIQDSIAAPFHTSKLPEVGRGFGAGSRIGQIIRMTLMELWATAKSPVFICVMIGVLLSVTATLSVRKTLMFGLSSLPVTFLMVDSIRESLIQFQIVLITFYAGVFVWKERDAKLDEIMDALPIPTWLSLVSKIIALFVIVSLVVAIGIFCGMFYQLASGFFDFQPGVYVQELLVIDMVNHGCLIVLAVLCHVIAPNKYVGYFGFIGLLIANSLVWPLLGIESKLLQFGNLPGYIYSDMFGRQPFAPALRWFGAYWILFSTLLGIVAVMFWPRGRESGWKPRIIAAFRRWKGGLNWAATGLLLAWLTLGAWIFWNTKIRNTYRTAEQTRLVQADYEKEYKSLGSQPQPRVTDIRYEIDIYPETRSLEMRGKQTIENRESSPITMIHVLIADQYDSEVQIEGATLASKDQESQMLTFSVDPPMQPGTSRAMEFQVTYKSKGFENSVQVREIVQNGTFLNNFVAPQIGYQPAAELRDLNQREKYGLSGTGFAPLDPDNLAARRNSYLSSNSDWVNIETVISTSTDQIAIAPGSLQKKWEKDGRRYFHYKLDHPSPNFYSFVSARYKVAFHQWNDVDIEIYYHPDHEWNVDLMLRSVRKSLEYYSEAFGPYKHKQARIIEFPRVASFAQAFPGTMPYSEAVGFIANLESADDIDMVYYVVAHEMAHQWWAHQVIGANMQGATMLSETLAQYSALMVMEKEYGRDMMRKFLKYEMDNYLRARGREKGSELPLRQVGVEQGYVHYNKGSVVMYHLKETIGENKLNSALRSVVDKFGYADGPYPTSADLIEAIRQQTPPEHYGLLADLFEHITLFENRTTRAEYAALDDGKFEVTIDVGSKKLRAGPDGSEAEVELNDWIEIGAFAKPKPGNQFGETLYRQRIHVNQSDSTFTFTVDQVPALAGVDPFSLLIDRNTSDNMKQPALRQVEVPDHLKK